MFDIDLTKKYGIMLSGGLDSAVLLGLILKHYPKINIIPFTIPKHDGAKLYASDIVSHLNSKYGTTVPSPIYVGDPNVYHRQQSTTAVIEIFNKHFPDFLFNALNRIPDELANLNGAPQRDKESANPKIILPFAHMLKTEILELMYANDLEDLVELTHSCTERQMTRCGQCWQCTERAWAFAQLNKLDKGTF